MDYVIKGERDLKFNDMRAFDTEWTLRWPLWRCSISVSPVYRLAKHVFNQLGNCNNKNSNSQLLRKCHNFSFCFFFSYSEIFFYMIEIFRVIKSLLLCNSLVFFSFLFFIHFSLSISLRRRFNLHHTPHGTFFRIIKWL